MHQERIAIVTGASSGIGKAIAFGLAKASARLILVCRNKEKGQAVLQAIRDLGVGATPDLLIADLSSQQSIRALANTLHEKYDHLDILINNAGVVCLSKTLSVDGNEMTLATNHLGPFLLTQLVLDMLEKGSDARIVNVSSAIHHFAKYYLADWQFNERAYGVLKAYALSKFLMNSTAFELARRLQGRNITVNCVHPGAVRTALGSDSTQPWYLRLADKVVKSFFIGPEKGAKTPLYLALSDEVRGKSGGYYVKNKQIKPKADAKDPALAKAIWERTESLLR